MQRSNKHARKSATGTKHFQTSLVLQNQQKTYCRRRTAATELNPPLLFGLVNKNLRTFRTNMFAKCLTHACTLYAPATKVCVSKQAQLLTEKQLNICQCFLFSGVCNKTNPTRSTPNFCGQLTRIPKHNKQAKRREFCPNRNKFVRSLQTKVARFTIIRTIQYTYQLLT